MQADQVDWRKSNLEEDYHWCLQFETMLTPSFNIEQNEDFIIITIRVPYIKISEAEFYMNGTEFKFHCKPYFLRLHLPGQLVEDGREKAAYDVDAGTIVVHAPKLNHGEHFDNLSMITTLLSKKPAAKDLINKVSATKPLIELAGEGEGSDTADMFDEDDFDWEVEQQLPTEDKNCQDCNISLPGSASKNAYGFAAQHSGVFTKLQEEIPSIVDCPDPDHMTSHDRRIGRIAHEETSFDPEYYLADLMDNDYIDVLLKFEPPWTAELVKWRKKCKPPPPQAAATISSHPIEPDSDILPFSAQERDQLKELPNKEYLLDKATRRILYLGLVDIVFAYAYNYRITEGENNVESAWTICKLSSTLSWLEVFRGSVHEVVYCSLRRSLCYPLYRHWQLALNVLQDTRTIFRLGRRKLLQCLLSTHRILSSSEPYYILNNLYISDYCVWVQRSSAKAIQKIADELDEVSVDITTVGWELVELEQAARLVLAEEEEEEKRDPSSDKQEHSTKTTTNASEPQFSCEVEEQTSSDGNLRTESDIADVSHLGQQLETISLRESNQTTASLGSKEATSNNSDGLMSLKLPGSVEVNAGRSPLIEELETAAISVNSSTSDEESDSTSTECSQRTESDSN